MKPFPKRALYILLAALGTVAAYLIYHHALSNRTLPEGLILANGRIEGDHVTVASKFAGRIAELRVREGDSVQVNQILAVLDDAQIKARVAQARAAITVLDAQIKASETALVVLEKELPLAIASAQAEVSRAAAAVAKAKAAELQARRDATRMHDLLTQNFVNRQLAERADLALSVASAEHATARHAELQAQAQFSQAKLGADRIRAKESELAALRSQRDQARASLAEAESVLADLVIKAPSAGVIVTRIRQAGDVVGAGGPLFDLVNLDTLYLKVYVPEIEIGKLRLNLPARIYTDAFPDTPFYAKVGYISARAEFTPKEVQTPDERVKLTYAVKLYLEQNPEHKLTPGLPADAVIRWKEGVPWAKPKW
ncbi:MAG: efflux RND transporter periplasmic adaptor subunit [Rhodospirillales bacterium]|nr:efflux RND transporter periplasmic adaptor subunit [Rhodospirillales bacterium]